jgi:hypothetical protein
LPIGTGVRTAESENRALVGQAVSAGVALLARNRDDALARRLTATGVTGFHYSTTARTTLTACRHRERLGEDFNRMLGPAVRWAAQDSMSLEATVIVIGATTSMQR